MSARKRQGRSNSQGSDAEGNLPMRNLRQPEQTRSSLPIHSTVGVSNLLAAARRNSDQLPQNSRDRRPQRLAELHRISPGSRRKIHQKRQGRPRVKSGGPKDKFQNPQDADCNYESAYKSADSPSTSEPCRGSTTTASDRPRKRSVISRKNKPTRPPHGTYLYIEESVNSSQRHRSTSIEVRVDVQPQLLPNESKPPTKRTETPAPCVHTDWNQAYEPKDCESERSRTSSKEPSVGTSCRRNTTTYCPEAQPASSENSSVLDRLTRGFTEDKALRTEVTIMERHRQHHKTVVKNLDKLRNPRNPFGDEESDVGTSGHQHQVSFQHRTSSSERYIEVERTNGRTARENFPGSGLPSSEPAPTSARRGFENLSARTMRVQPKAESPTGPSKLERWRSARAAMGLANSDEEPHEFPFKQTVSGNIKVTPEQLAFESKNVAVMISDPKQTRVSVMQQRDSPKSHPGGINQPRPPMIPSLPDQDSENETSVRGRNDNFHHRNQKDAQVQDSDFSEAMLRASARNLRSSSIQTQTFSDFEDHESRIRGAQDYAGQSEDCDSSKKDFFEKIHYRMKRAINPDTNILVGGQTFPCHGISLQVYSKFFDKKRRPREKIMEVEIPDRIITAKEFRNLMDWVLIGESFKSHVVSKENVVGLFAAAVYLDMPALREDCLEFVRVKVQEEDPAILKMYEEAGQKDNSQALMSLLSTKLSALFPKLYKSKQFLQMEAKELVTLLNSDTINIKSELDVYDAATRWLLYDWDTRRIHTVEVMGAVRFGLLSPLQLTQIRHSAEARNMPDYAKIYSFPEVKKFLQDGLTYAVFRESYRDKPGELNRWVEISEIRAPKFRFNLDDEPDMNRVPAGVSFDREDSMPRSQTWIKRNSLSEDDSNKKETRVIHNIKEPDRSSFESENVEIEGDDSMTTFRRESYSRSSRRSEQIENFQFEEEDNPTVQPSRRDIRVRAVVLIQARVRAWLARRWYSRIIYSVITIQRWYREHQRRMHIRNRYTPVKAQRTRKHLTLKQHYLANAPHVQRLTLDESAAFIIFGGHDPTKRIGEDNTATLIYQLDVHANVWSVVGKMPEPRVHSGAVRNKELIFIFGGADPRYRNSADKLFPVGTTWALHVENGKWHRLATMQISRRNFGYASMGGKIFVFGGVDEDGTTLSSCEAYDPEFNAWTLIESMDGPRTCMGVAKHGGKIWIAGGMAKYQSYPILKSVITYDVSKNRFSPEPALPFPVCFATMASYGDKLFLVGGAAKPKGPGNAQSLSSILIFEDDQWRVLTHLSTPRHGQLQINMGRYIALLGGICSFNMEALDTVETFNMEKYTTRDRITNMPQKLSGVCGVILH